MPQNPPAGSARIAPYLLYEDVGAALEWLARVFGFRERVRFAGADGTIAHAEMELGDGQIMLGYPGPEYQSPKRLGHVTHLVHVYVDDVDRHFEQAKASGATVLREPEDQPYGDRRYDAADLEGHHWSFAQHLRDVPVGEWGETAA